MKGGKMKNNACNAGSGAIYGLGFLGAAVYFLSHATTVWMGVVGLFQAIFWPGVLVYKVLEIMKL